MQNYGLTIYSNDENQIDLKDILSVIGEKGRTSNWIILNIECFGEAAEILHKYSDTKKRITGNKFYQFALNIDQVIDGVFKAVTINSIESWLIIRSIRGDEFDVETKDKEILDNIKNSFKEVKI